MTEQSTTVQPTEVEATDDLLMEAWHRFYDEVYWLAADVLIEILGSDQFDEATVASSDTAEATVRARLDAALTMLDPAGRADIINRVWGHLMDQTHDGAYATDEVAR